MCGHVTAYGYPEHQSSVPQVSKNKNMRVVATFLTLAL